MSWQSLNLAFKNESDLVLRLSKTDPPVLRNAELVANQEDASLSDIQPGSAGKFATFKRVAGAEQSLGCVTFTFGEPSSKLVVWLWMAPDYDLADVKMGIFPADKEINASVLDIWTPKAILAGMSGLQEESTYEKLKFNNAAHTIDVRARVDYQLIPDYQTDSYRFIGPDAVFSIRDHSYKESAGRRSDESTSNYKTFSSAEGPFGAYIHENMTIAALIAAGVVEKGMTLETALNNDKDTSDFFRGVVWNDDSLCALSNDDPSKDVGFALGNESETTLSLDNSKSDNNIGTRSHFDDLKFLHSMGHQPIGDPEGPREKIKTWIEVMYKVSIGQDYSEHTVIQDTKLSKMFNEDTTPKASDSLHILLIGRTPSYQGTRLHRRALGSCLHVVQDLCFAEHCQRSLIGLKDKIVVKMSIGTLGTTSQTWEFEDNILTHGFDGLYKRPIVEPRERASRYYIPGQSGTIQSFRSRDTQDDQGYAHQVGGDSPSSPNPSNIDSFNDIAGARNAIETCAKLARFWKDRIRWEDGPASFVDSVLRAAADTTRSNLNTKE